MMIPSHTLRFIKTLVIIVAAYLGLALAVYLVEAGEPDALIKTYPHALWYTLVTFSTVGYGDMYPVTTLGKFVGGVIIICAVGFISYAVGKLGDQLLENNRRKFLGMNGTKFNGHYIVVGWSELAKIVVEEIIAAGFNVALLTDSEDSITDIRSVLSDDRLFVVYGQFESDVAYDRLNLPEAAGVILLCEDDTRTLVVVLQLRELRPDVKITAYIQNSRLRRTVENAGVSYVVSPNEVIGRMIASATFEPDVSTFLEDILSTTTSTDDLDIQEYRLREHHELVGVAFGAAYDLLHRKTGARLLTYSRHRERGWTIERGLAVDDVLAADDYLILLANADGARALTHFLGVEQGRRA